MIKIKLSYLLIFNALFALFGAVIMILMPEQIWSNYGVELNSGGVFISQLFGTFLLGVATISWFSRNIRTRPEMMMVLPGFFIAHLSAAVLAFNGVNSGVVSSMTWGDIVIHLSLAAGFGYYFFVRDSTK